MSGPQLVSSDPNYGLPAAVTGAHPEARMGPPSADAPVTLGDLQDNPSAAFARIGTILKKDLTDPKTWMAAAAIYFGPKVINAVFPIVKNAVLQAPGALVRGTAAVADTVSPDAVGILSPRAGKVLKVAQQLRDAAAPATPVTSPVVETAAPAAAPAARVPLPPPPTPPAADTAPPPASRPAATSPKAAKLHLTVEEFQAAQGLIKQGYDPQAVLDAIAKNRLPKAWLNLPSDAEVRAKVTDRNATGKWSEEE